MPKLSSVDVHQSSLVKPTRHEPPQRPERALALVEAPNDPTSVWTPPSIEGGPPSTSDVLHVAPGALPESLELDLIRILRRPTGDGGGHAAGNAKREAELRALIADLDIAQAFHLRRRL